MKSFSKLIVTAGLVMASSAFSQDQSAAGLALRTRVMSDALPRATLTDIYITGGNQANVQYKITPDQTTSDVLPAAQFKYFYMFEPEDFLSAKESYQNGQYREARGKFGKVKSKLVPIMGMNDSYFQAAALFEIDSALLLLDWAAVKELVAAFPKQSPLTDEMKQDMEIYGLFAKLADKAYDEIISGAKAQLAKKDKLSLDQLSRLHYLLGLALAEKNEDVEALNQLASSVVGSHGGNRELAASAIVHSLDLLMRNPKVAELQKRVNMAEVKPTPGMSVPLEVKDAAALVYLYKNVLFPERILNPKYEWVLGFYDSPAKKAASSDALMKQPEQKNDAAAKPDTAAKPAAPAKTEAPAKKK